MAPSTASLRLAAPCSDIDVPPGYRRLVIPTGFMQICGDFYLHDTEPVMAARITAAHLNLQGIVHGGFLATLADSAYGAILRRDDRDLMPRTVQLSVNYLGAVHEGEFVEARVTFNRVGRRLAYGNCDVSVADRMVLQTTAVFSVMPATPADQVSP